MTEKAIAYDLHNLHIPCAYSVCFWDKLCFHYDPEQDKVVTKDE